MNRISTAIALIALPACTSVAESPTRIGPDLAGLPPGLVLQEPQGTPQEPRPVVPIDDGADWVQLVSGEWLRGEFDVLRDGTLEFESDELDELELDWDDITELHLSKPQTILLENGETYTGVVSVKDDTVRVGDHRAGRASLMSIVPDAVREVDYWSGKLSLGLTARSGNTDQTDVSAYAFLRREAPSTRWDSSYTGAYSELEGTETANNHHLRTRFDWFLTNRLFVTPVGVNVYRDRFQNIAWRITPYAAVGYDIIDSSRLSWDVSAGPAYQYTEYYSVAPGEDESDDTGAGVFSTNLDWDITSDIEFTFGYDLTVPVPETQKYNHHLVAMLSIDLVEDFDLDIGFVWDRVNQPAPGPDGTVPDKDDFRTTVGLGYSF